MRIIMLLALLALSGCIHDVPIVNTTDISQQDFSNANQWKRGESCESYLFGIFGPSGDASIVKAAIRGDIKRIKVVESISKNHIVGRKYCTVVYGE
jgi:hypothetical protein